MAEGGYFGYDDPDLDHNIDHDNVDDKDDEQEVNRTRLFEPDAASTPHHRGEEYEMKTMMQEQSWLPDTSYEENPLLTDLQKDSLLRQKMKNAVDTIKSKSPRANFKIIKIRRGKGKIWGKLLLLGTEGVSTRF